MSLYDNTPASATITEGPYTGTTPGQIVNLINTQSQLATATSAGPSSGNSSTANNFGQSGTYTLQGATDGSSATDTDFQNAINLAQQIDCDFIVALSGSAVVKQSLFQHVQAMVSQLKYREGFIGSAYNGVSAAQAVANALADSSIYTSQYVTILANTGGSRRDPSAAVGSNPNKIYDGFMWCAALGAMKAMNNPSFPLTRKQISGLLGLTEHFTSTQLSSMASQGALAMSDSPLPIQIFDGVTAVQQPSNYYKEGVVAQENRLVKIILARVNPLIGTADPNSNLQTIRQTVIDACNSAISQQIIVAIDPTQITVTPTGALGVYNVNVVYQPRLEISRLNFFITLNVALTGQS